MLDTGRSGDAEILYSRGTEIAVYLKIHVLYCRNTRWLIIGTRVRKQYAASVPAVAACISIKIEIAKTKAI